MTPTLRPPDWEEQPPTAEWLGLNVDEWLTLVAWLFWPAVGLGVAFVFVLKWLGQL